MSLARHGSQPYELTLDANGNLYGTTVGGGDLSLDDGSGGGTVFELSPPVPDPGGVSAMVFGALGLLARRRTLRGCKYCKL
jgi:uncharacterized repeat protein (TIGR03803 family)